MAPTMTSTRPGDAAVRRRKLLGLGVMAVPALVIGIFTVAEAVGWEEGWWGHLIQFALIVGLTALAWVRPRLGGLLLLVAGVALSGWILLRASGQGEANLPGVLLVFAPMAIAGGVFSSAGTHRTGGRQQR